MCVHAQVPTQCYMCVPQSSQMQMPMRSVGYDETAGLGPLESNTTLVW